MKSMLKNCAVDQVLGYYAAGVTKRTSDIVDMANFDGVMFVIGLGTTIENGTIDAFVEQDIANAITNMARLATTAVHTVTAANAALAKSCIVIDVYRPLERYVQCNITPAVSNAVVLGITAIRYKGRTAPVVQAAGTIKATMLTEPAQV